MKKKLLVLILLLLAGAGVVGYLMFNKKHFNVQKATPVVTVAAITLHQTFATDSVIAKNKFIGEKDESNKKVIAVEGTVHEMKTDQQENAIILLKTDTDGAFVNCTMEEKIENIIPGSKIVLKGICSGYIYEADMGIPGDVILTRCYQVKQ